MHMRTPDTAITVRQVSKRFGTRTVLDGLGLDIRQGETVVFWGPNGAGKTTALRCLLGVIPFEGSVCIFGCDVVRQGKQARRQIGYVPQELGLYGDRTVLETVAFVASLRRLPPQMAAEALAKWHLDGAASVQVRTLSGGMKQRLALGIALLGESPIVFLDEPASHLDVRTRRELYEALDHLKQAGKTLVLCSHRSDEILRLADRVLILENGRLVMDGTPKQLRQRLSGWVELSIVVSENHCEQAVALLAARGFHVQANHRQMWVRTRIGQQAEPIGLLAAAGIAIEDIGMETVDYSSEPS